MKTHWKTVFKSDFLSSSDLGEKESVKLTIREVRIVEVTNQRGKEKKNVAFFEEKEFKPMILNVTNSKMVFHLSGRKKFIEDWKNVPVEIYVDKNVKFRGDLVEGLRIRKWTTKKNQLPNLIPGKLEWEKAIQYLREGGIIGEIKRKYFLSEENEKKILKEFQDV